MRYCPICLLTYSAVDTTCPLDGTRLIEIREWLPGIMVRNKYRILGKLGQGGMGIVYKAEHVALEELRALKVMDPQLGNDPKFIRRFQQEARLARRVRHPNIVQVDDLDQAEDGSLFIAMEYIEGANLRQLIQTAGGLSTTTSGAPRTGPFTVQRALTIARGVAEALGALHALGIVHRDVKPSNVILTRDLRGWEQPKLLDFGIVALRESSSVTTSRPAMTPAYAAPEQWRGMKGTELDGRADFYSLGMTLYEMLTGRLPFHAHNIEEWMSAHLLEPPPAPSQFNAALLDWPGVDQFLLELMAKDRDGRPKDAQTLVLAISLLEALAVPQPSDRTPLSIGRRVDPRVPQGRGGAPPQAMAEAGVLTPRASGPSVLPPIQRSEFDIAELQLEVQSPDNPAPVVGPAARSPKFPVVQPTRTTRRLLRLSALAAVILITIPLVGQRAGWWRTAAPTDVEGVAPTVTPAIDSSLPTRSISRPPNQRSSGSLGMPEQPSEPPPAVPLVGSSGGAPVRREPTPGLKRELVKAKQLLERGEYDAAITAYASVLATDPVNRDANEGASLARRGKETQTQEKVAAELTKARQLMEQGEYDSVITAFEAALRMDPTNIDAQVGIARAVKAREAEKIVNKMLKRIPR